MYYQRRKPSILEWVEECHAWFQARRHNKCAERKGKKLAEKEKKKADKRNEKNNEKRHGCGLLFRNSPLQPTRTCQDPLSCGLQLFQRQTKNINKSLK